MQSDVLTSWWIAAALVLALELFTGTFFLLLLALGLAAAGVAALLGAGSAAQTLTAALGGGGAMLALRAWRLRRRTAPGSATDPAQHLDLGLQVRVERWRDDGLAEVSHRGCTWTARLDAAEPPGRPGLHVIVGVDGTTLRLRALR